MTFFLFVVAEIANVAVIRGMMRCFFDVSSKVTPKEYAGYFLYYVFHLAAHLMRIETAAFFVGQAILLSAITFLYSSDLKSKFCTSLYISAAVLFSDFAFLILCGCGVRKPFPEDISCCLWACLASKLALLALVRLLTVRKRWNYSFRKIPGGYLMLITIIPAASLCLLSILMGSNAPAQQTAGCVLCIMALNGAALSLYFHASAYYDEAVQQAGFAEKAISKAGYIRSVTASVNDLRIFRHDMANHFTVLDHYLKEGNAKKSLDYLQRMARQCRNQEDIKTGSSAVDGILGRKVLEAKQKGIRIFCDVSDLGELPVPDYDLTCILGNLLDNAIEAAQRTPDREIRIDFRRSGRQLIFSIRNTFQGIPFGRSGFPVTTKRDRRKHGIGLQSVARTVKKFNGTLELRQEGRYFCASVKISVN